MGGGGGGVGAYSRLGANSRLGAYSNRYGNVFTAGFKTGSLCLELSFTAGQQVGYSPAFVTCIVPGLA